MRFLICLVAAFALFGCESTGSGVSTKQATLLVPDCVFPDAPDTAAPLWVCDVPVEGYALTSVGYSEKRPTLSMTTESAATDARNKMSAYFAAEVAQLFQEVQKSIESESTSEFSVDTDMVRQSVNSMTLFGTKVVRSLASPNGGHYVVVAMDDQTYKSNTEKVFAALSDENAMMKQMFENETARERLMGKIGAP
ncbi:hypothetical protein DXV75_11825 [Alteromonas aestuariivivens]|uniref:Lipoprotein LPP20-like domain-containing protein n=1 Tax=Alteromonas aestuariivivens TaxID=1938339 RepID=A0A3D8M6H3_9ALTE|nr:LPP20 family lipoprotein [Alteromonas aestuariivivens]RDV24762.1 hypothetical protein DXV75_11825 [Alteromonas aestuariivivens]